MTRRNDPSEFIAALRAIKTLGATPTGRAWIRSVVREWERDQAREGARRIAVRVSASLREDRNLTLLRRMEPPSQARH